MTLTFIFFLLFFYKEKKSSLCKAKCKNTYFFIKIFGTELVGGGCSAVHTVCGFGGLCDFFFMETSGAGNLGINDLGPLV